MGESFLYTDPLPEGWLQLDEGDRAAQLLARVQENLTQRAAEWGNERPHFAVFAGISAAPTAMPLESIASHLQQALELMQHQDTAPVFAPSPAARLPVLGRLWALMRAQAHQLVLFYVNRQAAQSAQINQHLLHALTELAQLLTAQQETITRLQGEKSDAPPAAQS